MHFTLNEPVLMLGRVLLGGLYVRGGVVHFFEIPLLVEKMTARGVPMPRFTLVFGSIFQAVCGVLVMAGIYTVPAAWGLVAFTVVASIMFLNFWDMQGLERRAAANGCFSNLAIIGGLFILAAF
ncbi:MAG TPA: DoxX family protein [Gammaproteobacteria bacterium]|nr:DoxX family protein [Gammaproteobacteria bacterium]